MVLKVSTVDPPGTKLVILNDRGRLVFQARYPAGTWRAIWALEIIEEDGCPRHLRGGGREG